MQRKSGHSVITPTSTSRSDAAQRRPTARERRTMMAPNLSHLTLAKLSAFLEATKANPGSAPRPTSPLRIKRARAARWCPMSRPTTGVTGKQREAQPFKEGRGYAIRVRHKDSNSYISGKKTEAAARKAAHQQRADIDAHAAPKGLGPD